MDTNNGPQDPLWQGKPPQTPPWMQQPQQPQNEQPPPWIQQPTQQGPMQPRQTFQPPMMPPPKKKKSRVGCLVAGLIGVLVLCAIVSNAAKGASQTAASPTPTVISNPALSSGSVPTQVAATHAVQPTPTSAPPTPTPTHAVQPPTPTPVPRPTQSPAPTPVPQLGIQFTTVVNEDVAVQTSPGATLTIKVLYHCSGHYATSQSLQGTFTTDSVGNMEWTWTNRSSCRGTVTAYVTASAGGKTVSNAADFSD